jgi:hypothetical protein
MIETVEETETGRMVLTWDFVMVRTGPEMVEMASAI